MSSANKFLFVLGRVLLALFFLRSAFNHFTQVDQLAGWAAAKGVPMPEVAIVISGVLLLIGGVSIGFGVVPRLGIAALALFLIPVTLMMHDFWAIEDPAESQTQMVHFFKNVAVLGATFMFAAIPRPWAVSAAQTDEELDEMVAGKPAQSTA